MSEVPMAQRLGLYLRLMRFHRPIGIWLLLWPTLWALWLAAGGWPPLNVLVVFVLGTALMRGAGCVINDYADRAFDPHVARTRDRPIAAGLVTPDEAIRLFVAVSLIAFALVSSLRNMQVILLSIPAAAIAALYPFTKRWISVPQVVLGVAFSCGIPMAYAAVRHAVPIGEVLLLMGANLCWVIAYDTYYAMADRADDLKIGVKSSAILFGRADRLAIGLLHGTALLLLVCVGVSRGLGPAYYAGLTTAAAVALNEQRLTRERDPAQCFKAFLHNNLFGGFVFLGLLLDLR
jgi:4-hydroxybenzoate polyprenyltransferase